MKKLIVILFILSATIVFGQQTGWVKTGKSQMWPATIHLFSGQTIQGFCKYNEIKYIPKADEPGKDTPPANEWKREDGGNVYDAAKKRISVMDVNYIECTQPGTNKVRH